MLNSWGGSPNVIAWVELPRAGSRMRHLGESVELGPWIVQLQFDPDHEVPAHWHKCDTIYIINEGSISFGPDGSGVDRLYRAGDIPLGPCRALLRAGKGRTGGVRVHTHRGGWGPLSVVC